MYQKFMYVFLYRYVIVVSLAGKLVVVYSITDTCNVPYFVVSVCCYVGRARSLNLVLSVVNIKHTGL